MSFLLVVFIIPGRKLSKTDSGSALDLRSQTEDRLLAGGVRDAAEASGEVGFYRSLHTFLAFGTLAVGVLLVVYPLPLVSFRHKWLFYPFYIENTARGRFLVRELLRLRLLVHFFLLLFNILDFLLNLGLLLIVYLILYLYDFRAI